MKKLVFSLLALTISMAILSGCIRQPAKPAPTGVPKDGIEHVTQKYAIPRVRVIALATLLGIPESKIPAPKSYDDLPFPISYFKEQFEEFVRTEDRLLLRSDVDKMVKGYVGRCQVAPTYTKYIFFSKNTQRTWKKREVAVIMSVGFGQNDTEGANPRDANQAIYLEVHEFALEEVAHSMFGQPYYNQCVRDYLEEQAATIGQ